MLFGTYTVRESSLSMHSLMSTALVTVCITRAFVQCTQRLCSGGSLLKIVIVIEVHISVKIIKFSQHKNGWLKCMWNVTPIVLPRCTSYCSVTVCV